MAIENPKGLIALESTLQKENLNQRKKKALTVAHNSLGVSEVEKRNFENAKAHFSSALKYLKNDTTSLYNLFMVEGHILRKTGEKEFLWDAIQSYYSAAQLKPVLGDPYFYIGQSYQKLGDQEFDLIIESYQKALKLELSNNLKKRAISEHEIVSLREKKLKEFWK